VVSSLPMSQPRPEKSPKLTDAERHARFKEMAREVEASEDPQDFDRAFEQVAGTERPPAADSNEA
jgi:hypothetical protein